MASIQKRVTYGAMAWQARWRDPDGRQRKKTFPRKVDAERFIATVEADKLRGRYIDPDAGSITFAEYAERWLASRNYDEPTYVATDLRLRNHMLPVLGSLELRRIKPSTIQSWLRGLAPLAGSYQRVIYANVSAILSAAVDDELLVRNPCKVNSVTRPRLDPPKITVWSAEQLHAVHDALPDRYALVATLGAGLGLRQGEIFGLSVDDIDFLHQRVTINRQVRLFADNTQAFALPKGRKTRVVPLPSIVAEEIAAYIQRYRHYQVTLPWTVRDGEPTTARLLISTRERNAVNRNYFNARIWKRALQAAGIAPTRANGCHALRHRYASTLIDAGESIKAVSTYLGHADPGFTLRVYTHLLPASEERTKAAIDAALRAAPPPLAHDNQ